MGFDFPTLMQTEKDKKRALLGATKMEQERERKKIVAETEEKLDWLGGDNEKEGIKAAKQLYDEHKKEQFTAKSDRISWLNHKAKFSKDKKKDYYPFVKVLVDYELSWLNLPYGYTVKSEVTDKGIKLILKDRFGNFHLGAFAPCGLGLFDEQACRSAVNKIDDKISALEANPPNRILLP